MRPTTQTLFTRRIFHGALFSAIILAVCWPLYLYLHPDLRDLDDFDALKKKPEAEQRSFLHRVLKNPRGNHHDAFGMLQLVGDETSVPIILKVLKRYAPSGEFSM
ncbi:MAG: hypothetical protein QG656_1575, partial [Candidatus Hydrogenedentes bacterium]|nr:hypothetical protein [Candidatus Hydrogenedentota bacterium]